MSTAERDYRSPDLSGSSLSALLTLFEHPGHLNMTSQNQSRAETLDNVLEHYGADESNIYSSDDMELSPKDLLPADLPGSMKAVFLVLYLLIIVLSLVGNVLVVLVVVRNHKMRTVTNTFLVSLAISDLLIAALNMPLQLRFYLQNEWTLGEPLCKFTKYFQGVVIVSSILTLTGIAVDRSVSKA